MTKQRYESILLKANKLVSSFMLLCCGLVLVSGIFFVSQDVAVNAESVFCATKNNETKAFVEYNCNELSAICATAGTSSTVTGYGKTYTYYCNYSQEGLSGTKKGSITTPPATPDTKEKSEEDKANLGGKPSPIGSGAATTAATGTTPPTPALPKLGLVKDTAKDPCEGRYSGQAKENSELFDCSKNPLPAFENGNDTLAKTQPDRLQYINEMCKNVNGSKAYSSPTHNQKWTCKDGKLDGAVSNITNDKIQRSQIDEWQKTAKKNVLVDPPKDGAEFLGRNLGCAINKTTIRLIDLPNIGNFTPIIPINCTTTPDGFAIPISPVVAVQVIVRLFGFIASFIFYLINFVLVYNGLMWVYSGFDGKSQATAKRNIADLVWALVLLLGAYVIISTIVGLIGAGSVETDLSTFFNVNTKL